MVTYGTGRMSQNHKNSGPCYSLGWEFGQGLQMLMEWRKFDCESPYNYPKAVIIKKCNLPLEAALRGSHKLPRDKKKLESEFM